MIEEIQISNLGVIAHSKLQFSSGLNVLTGETGAGKTMVLSSISLLMGQKADSSLVRYETEQASVEGIFSFPDSSQVKTLIEEAGGEVDQQEAIIARSVKANGRSRAYAGGRTVPAGVLERLSQQLVTVHGQSEQMILKSAPAQLQLLDSFGGEDHQQLLEQYQNAYLKQLETQKALRKWEDEAALRAQEIARLEEGLGDLEELAPQIGEETRIVNQIDRLANVEDLYSGVQGALGLLNGKAGFEDDVSSELAQAINHLEKIGNLDSELAQWVSSLRDATSIVSDVVGGLSDYLEELAADPLRLEQLQQRLSDLRSSYRRWVKSADEWVEWGQEATRRLQKLTGPNNQGQLLADQLAERSQQVTELGEKLHRARCTLASKLAAATQKELDALAMGASGFGITVTKQETAGNNGYDQVAFGLKQGKKSPLRPLGQGASGGELSRIMLALEVVLGGQRMRSASQVPTFIFDEVDAGIGGETALAVGRRLAQLAKSTQVIVVTHLPQVAAWADHQLVVKRQGNTTAVEAVTGKKRTVEIARMLSGKTNSASALQHADELINACQLESV